MVNTNKSTQNITQEKKGQKETTYLGNYEKLYYNLLHYEDGTSVEFLKMRRQQL